MHDSIRTRAQRLSLLIWLLLAFMTAVFFSAAVRTALADHYHCDTICHGFVHGESTTDGSFFSRVREGTAPRSCQIDTVNNPGGYKTRHIGDYVTVCQIWSHEIWQSATECLYRAEVYASPTGQFFNWHHHRPDNYCA